jgi:glutamate/tyrosine decarboxylase-like PLP-dependent enzyme
MTYNLQEDVAALREILDAVKNQSVAFLEGLDTLQTSAVDQQIVSGSLPQSGLGASGALDLFNMHFQKLIVAAAGPRYWGYVVGGVTPAALAGDWLTGVFDQNTQSTGSMGDISATIEVETLRMLLELFKLPPDFNGGFVSGATMSNFTSLAVARQWAGSLTGKDIAREGVCDGIAVLAATPHSSVIKSLAMLGLGSNNLIKVGTLEGREALDVSSLEASLIELEGKAVILSCSAGTVNTVDFYDFSAIVALKNKYGFWLHIDAAFGGFVACSPANAYLLNGWESADSITIDCHKWMNLPYDSAIFLTRKTHERFQIQTFQNSSAPYLGELAEGFSYLNFLPENSRRFRALSAWFSLTAYGSDGYQWIVENSIACARNLAEYISSSDRFVLSAPVLLNVVCFSLNGDSPRNQAFLEKLNARGKVFMTPSVVFGKPCIRAAFVNYRTKVEDVSLAIGEMEAVCDLLI